MGLTRPRAYQIFDIDYKQSVRVVTVSNVTLGGGAPSQVDGVSLSLNDRVLVTAQSTGSQNGLYYVTTVGTGSNGTWARSVDGNETGEIDAGMIVMVTEGTIYADTQWKLTTNDPIVIGSTALTFVQNYSANSISAGTSNVVVNSNADVTISAAGTANVLTVTSTGANVAGYANITGNIDTVGAININSSSGMYNVLNITGTALAPYGSSQTWKFFTQNAVPGGPGSWILFPDSSTQTTAYPGSSSTLSLSGNITGGNLIANTAVIATGNITGGNVTTTGIANIGTLAVTGAGTVTGNITGGNVTTAGQVTATANITGGNLLTVGQISSTGTITTAAGTNSTGFSVGNGAVSNVGLGFFPTAGTRGDYAIRDYSSVFSTMYLDVGMGGSAGGEFQFRSSNAYNLVMRANTTGVYSSGVVSATGIVYGSELTSTQSIANEGGQINLALPSSGSTLSTSVIIDVYQNRLRFFEGGGTARGAYIDLTSCSAGAATNLLAGGGGGTPGGSNTYVQFNDGGTFGGNGQFVYDKVTNTLTAGIIAANNNGAGTNFKVGDDAWIGDINAADTMRVMGQQNAANAYIVFGNADGVALGRAGSGALTYGGAFTATGNITGGNLSGTSIVGTLTTAAQTNITSVGTLGSLAVTANITGGNANISGRILVGSGNASAPGITFSADTSQDTGFYWISDGNIGVSTNGSLRVTFDNNGNVTATGNISGGNIIANGRPLTSLNATNIDTGTLAQARLANSSIIIGNTTSTLGATVTTITGLTSVTSTTFVGALTGAATSATTAGTVTTAAQPNITSVGTLSSLTVTANVTGGNLITAGQVSATGNITGGNIIANGRPLTSLNATNIDTGTLAQARLANSSIIIGNTTSTLGATVTTITGLTSVTSTTFVGALTGAATSATTAGTVTTAAQPNITSVGTLSSLTVTANVTGGNLVTAGQVSATGNITGGNIIANGRPLTSLNATNIDTGTLAQARLANSAVTLGSTALTLGSTVTTVAGLTSVTSTTFVGSLSGAATTAGTVTTAAQPNITSTGTLSSLSVTGNITSSTGHVGTIYTNSIINTGANATGNIGSSTLYFNTAFVKATSAQYADLAEMYVADADYAPGTVVEFGGSFEITQTTTACSTAVAGIISTNPSYLMNATQPGEYVLPVALTGRVPCQVQGPVKKGDVLISSNIPGVAQRIGANWQPGCTVGKAMENITEAEVRTIEVAVGRL